MTKALLGSSTYTVQTRISADLISFTEEILNVKLQFLCSDKVM